MFSDSESDEPLKRPSSSSRHRNSAEKRQVDREITTSSKVKAPLIDVSSLSGQEIVPPQSSEEEDELPVRRKRVVQESQTPCKKSRREHEDLKEDLEFLEPMSKSLMRHSLPRHLHIDKNPEDRGR